MIYDPEIKARVRLSDFLYGIDLTLYTEAHPGEFALAEALVFTPYKVGSRIPPTTTLDHTSAQKLMDGLWDCGIRPSEGTGSAGAFAAQTAHLKDLQRLVFKEKK